MSSPKAVSVPPKSKVELVDVGKLDFDPQNPRLVEMENGSTQTDMLRVLWRDMAVDEVALSIAANGYFLHEVLFAEKNDHRYTVIEGNRRLAAVKLLLDARLRRKFGATDLPEISEKLKTDISKLPVIICTRKDIWQYTGFKHVNGPQTWESYSKAQYIARVRDQFRVPLNEIARTIGDQHTTVKRLYRALKVLEQAEDERVFEREDRQKKHFSFSHLYTGLDYPGIQKFIGIARDGGFDRDKPVPPGKIPNLGELLIWLYGSKIKEKQPLIRSQNPDLRILDEVLQGKNGIAALRSGLPLQVARDASRGDERLFREALVEAKQALVKAKGTLLTGYRGETDLIDVAQDNRKLANSIVNEMENQRNDSTGKAR